MGRVRIGISGWRYANWRGTFYPAGLAQRNELSYAAKMFSTIELNGSFYSLQRPEFYRAWYHDTPSDFVFAVKAPRYITHLRRLKEVETPMANFFASGALCLEEKFGPILWQFPPNFPFLPERFEPFFRLLPKDTREAARLARRHDAKVEGRAYTRIDEVRPLRHAIEIRHPSFSCVEFITLLRTYGLALVVADTADRWPYLEDVTADFLYLRLHGDEELYASGYTDEALERWATRIARWRTGKEPRDARRASTRPPPKRASRDVYVYFDNDVKVHAPFDAERLAERLGESRTETGRRNVVAS